MTVLSFPKNTNSDKEGDLQEKTSEADRLLIRFSGICVMTNRTRRRDEIEQFRQEVFDYLKNK